MGNKTLFLETGNIAKCCSCGNCVSMCPCHALTMIENKEGFFYPKLTESKCVDCGLCSKVCVYNNLQIDNKIIGAYAVQNKNTNVLKRSSSGGVFFAVAEWIINLGGVVFGCVFDTDTRPVIALAETLDQCVPMQGSKYVEADLNGSFAKAKTLLKQGRIVLFTGTPCMIASLKLYLHETDCSQLYTLEFLCHGVPSRKLFQENVAAIEEKENSKIVTYSFRDKTLGWGQATGVEFSNGKQKYWNADWQPYHYGYLKGYLNRYSCYNCLFEGEARCADITIGDFWGAYKYFGSAWQTSQGVSLFISSTQKGNDVFQAIKDNFLTVKSSVNDMAKENSTLSLCHAGTSVPPEREIIYSDFEKYGFEYISKQKYMRPKLTIKRAIKRYLPLNLQKVLKKLKG